MRIEVVQARARGYEAVTLTLPEGATVGDAVQASGLGAGPAPAGLAVFGVLATAATPLVDGDRVELLQPLQVDPKEARRRRAAKL
ncbi:RnfH family protein [Pseudoxanthomonas sp. JBR18]|uniref:RnfH family protein n=1 Tax=Pseudoxanthomonas sp. JBR18 TaxID=2969308 RepID=UPI00230622DC|nr:RnfH family protein [Pseudoxanthomonas sp. JBR18]WCE03657.1 RnfH family protein [Pseudoxanthomonas sp. JBR18]